MQQRNILFSVEIHIVSEHQEVQQKNRCCKSIICLTSVVWIQLFKCITRKFPEADYNSREKDLNMIDINFIMIIHDACRFLI